MDFRHNSDVIDLRDATRSYLEGENPPERLRGLADGGDPLKLWPQLAEMGLFGASLSETQNGLGLQFDEMLPLCEEAGRACLPEPFSETAIILVPVLVQLDKEDLAKAVASGETRGAISHPLNPFVNHGEDADFILICGGETISIVHRGDFDTASRESIDPARRLSSFKTQNEQIFLEGGDATDLTNEIAARGAIASAAELCGLSARMISLATEYSTTREQFGQAIGTFQAVKHLMANAQVQLEFARPVVYRAGAAIEDDKQKRDVAAAHAKLAASRTAMLAAENAIQVFGGMGYTFEVDLHFFMKRVWALCGQWGDQNHHTAIIEAGVLDGGMAIGPSETFNTR